MELSRSNKVNIWKRQKMTESFAVFSKDNINVRRTSNLTSTEQGRNHKAKPSQARNTKEWQKPDRTKDKLSNDIYLRAWFKVPYAQQKSSHPKEGLTRQNSCLSAQFSNEHLGTNSATTLQSTFHSTWVSTVFQGLQPTTFASKKNEKSC